MIVYEICHRDYDSYNRPTWNYTGDLYLYEADAIAEVARLTEQSNDGYKNAFMSNLKLWGRQDAEELALIRAGLRPPRTQPFYHKLTLPTGSTYKYEPLMVNESREDSSSS